MPIPAPTFTAWPAAPLPPRGLPQALRATLPPHPPTCMRCVATPSSSFWPAPWRWSLPSPPRLPCPMPPSSWSTSWRSCSSPTRWAPSATWPNTRRARGWKSARTWATAPRTIRSRAPPCWTAWPCAATRFTAWCCPAPSAAPGPMCMPPIRPLPSPRPPCAKRWTTCWPAATWTRLITTPRPWPPSPPLCAA